jgi:hypothetical protein
MEKLEIVEDEVSNCWYTYASEGLFEVEYKGRRYVVNLQTKTCGCRKCDVFGIPYAHAILAIWHSGSNPSDYLSEYFGKEVYLKSYAPIIYLVPSEE